MLSLDQKLIFSGLSDFYSRTSGLSQSFRSLIMYYPGRPEPQPILLPASKKGWEAKRREFGDSSSAVTLLTSRNTHCGSCGHLRASGDHYCGYCGVCFVRGARGIYDAQTVRDDCKQFR